MSAAHLELTARPTPELLERVCRVLRHRGATVEHLVHETVSPTRTRLTLRAQVTGEVDLLIRQLTRLPDVDQVRSTAGPAS